VGLEGHKCTVGAAVIWEGQARLKPGSTAASLLVGLALGLSACSGSTQAINSTTSLAGTSDAAAASTTASPLANSTVGSAAYAPLLARPLKLPTLSANGPCPVSATRDFASPPGQKLPGYGSGPGPLFLSGQTEYFSGVYALLLVSPDYSGPVVVRGRELNGPTGIPFQDAPKDGVVTIAPGPKGQWRSWGSQVVGQAGCYGLQVEGTSFTEVIIFSISYGAAPPA
jgi:hypothetical protein